MDKLKPCPFCGTSEPREYHRTDANTVTCMGCGIVMKQSALGFGDAAERWNRRAQSPWIRCEDRLPTEADAEHSGKKVWVDDPTLGPILMHWAAVTANSIWSQWKPVERPKPPEA